MSHELQILPSQTSGSSVPLPLPRVAINIRPATMDDLPFIDGLQKKHTKQVGFMPTKQFEGKIRLGHVLVAEERSEVRDQKSEDASPTSSSLTSDLRPLTSVPVGYLIGNDQYFKRDDVGIIYQINIAEGKRRSLVGASLLKAQFDRSAYGCRLYCCWCAQDIEANRFWESMGFVPLAFRTGSAAKSRVHIFWQKRIRAGDETTAYWFPAQTNSGSIREDRLVLPIPPGKHWSDEMPRVLPALSNVEGPGASTAPALPAVSSTLRLRPEGSGVERPGKKTRNTGKTPMLQKPVTTLGRLQFVVPKQKKNAGETPTPRKKQKNDPKLIAAARELRDRWLEKVNSGQYLPEACGKYDVSKSLPSTLSNVEGSKELSAPLPKEILQLPQSDSTSSTSSGQTSSPQAIAA